MMTSTDRPADQLLGERALELLVHRTGWIVRRKEGVEVINEETLRRRHSVDFDDPGLPPLQTSPSGSPVQWLPLFLLPKLPRQYSDFDLEDALAGPIPLPTRTENARISAEAVKSAALQAIDTAVRAGRAQSGTSLTNEMLDVLDQLALTTEPSRATRLQGRFDTLLRHEGPELEAALNDDDDFVWLFSAVADSSIVMVPVVGDPQRRIIKLSYDESIVPVDEAVLERLGWRPYTLLIDLPFVGAGTFHFQAEAPAGMQIVESILILYGEDFAEADVGLKSRVHLYVGDTADARTAVAYVRMRVRGAGFVGGALVASVVVALTITLCAIRVDTIAENATSAPALLLALPAALAGYASRSADHPLTTRLLASARRLVLASAMLAFASAAAVAIHVAKTPAGPLKPVLIAAAVVAWGIVLLLWETRRLPIPSTERSPIGLRLVEALFDGSLARWLEIDVTRSPTPRPNPPPLFSRRPAFSSRALRDGMKRALRDFIALFDQTRYRG